MQNFFRSIDVLEPKCPCCSAKIDYDVTTRFDDKLETHICLNCNHQI